MLLGMALKEQALAQRSAPLRPSCLFSGMGTRPCAVSCASVSAVMAQGLQPPQTLQLHSISAALGHQDLPEEEELGDIQLPAVLLPLWNASPALREPV